MNTWPSLSACAPSGYHAALSICPFDTIWDEVFGHTKFLSSIRPKTQSCPLPGASAYLGLTPRFQATRMHSMALCIAAQECRPYTTLTICSHGQVTAAGGFKQHKTNTRTDHLLREIDAWAQTSIQPTPAREDCYPTDK